MDEAMSCVLSLPIRAYVAGPALHNSYASDFHGRSTGYWMKRTAKPPQDLKSFKSESTGSPTALAASKRSFSASLAPS